MPLVLAPYRLFTDYVLIESLQVVKTNGSIDCVIEPIENSVLRKNFPDLPKDAKDCLLDFNKDIIKATREEIKKVYDLQPMDISFETYFRAIILRKLHEKLMRLKPYMKATKWYHKQKQERSGYKTSPCSINNYRLQLEFIVVKNEGKLQLNHLYIINGSKYNAAEFTRFEFLLESQSEYFILSFKDYQIIEWLEQKEQQGYAQDSAAFVKEILQVLEADYTVNRNGLFETVVIETSPINRILLSEISGSFLVLTPQFTYDGFVVEGVWKPDFNVLREGESLQIIRDQAAETAFIDLIKSLHPRFTAQHNGYYYVSFEEAKKRQWFLKVYHQLLEQNVHLIGMDMLQHFRYSPEKAVTTVAITDNKEKGTLTLQFSLHFGKEEVPLHELKKILLSGQRAVFLKDGSLGVLSEDWIAQYGIIIKHGKIGKKEIEVARWMALHEEGANTDNQVLKPIIQSAWWDKWAAWQQTDHQLYRVPAMVQASLRPYQQKGFEWMLLLSELGAGACLADDMGLGKTLQTICVIAQRIEAYPHQKHLIVCPSSLVYNWMEELLKFAPSITTAVYHGAGRDLQSLLSSNVQVFISSYSTVRNDIDKLAVVAFGIMVIDESHNIKNPASQITKAVSLLHADVRVALSGTPVMNNTFDLYAQLSFLLPGMFGSREFFKTEYADAIDRGKNPEKIKALQRLTAPFILRRTKSQVASDLPEKTETILWCDMSSDQKFAYESIKENIKNSIALEIQNNGLHAGKLSVLAGMIKLRQVCNSCELIKDQEIFCTDSAKTDVLLDELKNLIESHKALVFSQFTSMLDLLERDLTKHNIPVCRIDGSTAITKRQEIVNRFQAEDSREKVFLISLKAGNAGLTLTAADYVFLFDPWWNTAVQQQAIDRTHRIGQTKSVFAYKMICKGTIEEKIIQLQQRKKQLAEELISEEEGFVKSLTEEDIAFLFS